MFDWNTQLTEQISVTKLNPKFVFKTTMKLAAGLYEDQPRIMEVDATVLASISFH